MTIMDMTRPEDSELSAWLDGELAPEARAQVDAWLRDHPDDAAQVRLWAADRDALRARLGPLADEAVPESLAPSGASRPIPGAGLAPGLGGRLAAGRWRHGRPDRRRRGVAVP